MPRLKQFAIRFFAHSQLRFVTGIYTPTQNALPVLLGT
ncbi:hypothetical protein GXM_02876 [Nostoc sphaeroides CCNUC1]|uniref:Uncharacterized protein n=1 Tax=Nostoc sphaeroides CCNUC1 TaxID=2653204 RepID=A0A5P8W032_9NOSO|nr:hypothetical protein GXM_02876 [Nostoc sphaeroides CCNUC1]